MYFVLLHYFLWFGTAYCLEKRWILTSNFEDTNNWPNGLSPCGGSKVGFTKPTNLPVLITGETSLGELVLNHNVELIWSENSGLHFIKDSAGCDANAEVLVFAPPRASAHWWDPDVWESSTEEETNRRQQAAETRNQAVPDTERVPCSGDQVKLPGTERPESIYQIMFSGPVPTVSSLMVGNQSMTTSSFARLGSAQEGRVRFKKDGRTYRSDEQLQAEVLVYVENEGACTDPAGCTCNTHSSIPDEICRIKSRNCPDPSCAGPIKVLGFCCDFCGIDIAISTNGSLSMKDVRQVLKETLSDSSGVDGYVARMDTDFLHVYFTSSLQNPGDYIKAAASFETIFARRLNSQNIHLLNFLTATGSFHLKSGGNSGWAKFGEAVLALLCICAVSLFLYKSVQWYMKKPHLDRNRLRPPLIFQRARAGSRISLVSRRASFAPPLMTSAFSNTSEPGLRFVNPVFNTSTESLETPSIPATPQELPQQIVPENPSQRENPLFNLPGAADQQAEKTIGMTFSKLKDLQEEEEPQEGSGKEECPDEEKTEVSGETTEEKSTKDEAKDEREPTLIDIDSDSAPNDSANNAEDDLMTLALSRAVPEDDQYEPSKAVEPEGIDLGFDESFA